VTVKKHFVGGNPPFYLQVLFLVLLLFIALKKIKNTKIFSLKQSEEQKFQVQYWAKT